MPAAAVCSMPRHSTASHALPANIKVEPPNLVDAVHDVDRTPIYYLFLSYMSYIIMVHLDILVA
jgi:hypothetical protein